MLIHVKSGCCIRAAKYIAWIFSIIEITQASGDWPGYFFSAEILKAQAWLFF